MATEVIVGFSPSTVEPIDSRLIAIDANDRLSRKSYNCYKGLLVFQQDTEELYACTDPSIPSSHDSWLLVSSGTTSSFFSTTEIIRTGSLTVVENNTINNAFTVEGGTTLISNSITNTALTVEGATTIVNNNNTALTIEGGTTINNNITNTSVNFQGDTNNILIITSESNVPVTINSQGLIVLDEFSYTPDPISGGILYSGSNFYLGINCP